MSYSSRGGNTFHHLSKMQHVSSLPIVAAFAILSWLLEPVVAASKANGSVVRTYYVGAVEEDWDYLPTWVNVSLCACDHDSY